MYKVTIKDKSVDVNTLLSFISDMLDYLKYRGDTGAINHFKEQFDVFDVEVTEI